MSKKVLVAIAIFIVVVGGAFVATKLKSNVNYQNEQVLADTQSEKLYKDSDGDGLKDWEEGLWGTDPNNPDTNGDGINDYDEIRAGINPLGKSLDDKLATDTVQKKVNPSVESDLTETDKMSMELFAKYVQSKQNGDYASTSDYTNFFFDYLNNNSNKDDVTIYKDTDMKSVSETAESLRVYGNTLGKIIIDNAKLYPGNELQILDDAIAKNDTKILDQLDNPIKRYTGLRDGMLGMPVPEGIVSIHVKMLNLLNIMVTGIQNMKLIISDPVKGLTGTSLYPNASGYFIDAVKELHDYFVSHKVIFGKNESGYELSR